MDARMKEFIEACNEDAFAILMINIADTTLKNRLRPDYDDNAHGAWTYIEHLHVWEVSQWSENEETQ
eukprot:4421923-Pleurochrysis_carterae.AAC.1